MSDSSDSDNYSSRVLSKNKTTDENFMSCKNNFIQDIQNRSYIPNVVKTSFSNANESFVNGSPKRKREHFDESENDLNSSQTNKKKKRHHNDEGDIVDNVQHDFVTVREGVKKKSKKKNHTLPDVDELDISKLESEGSKKKHKKNKMLSLPGELNMLEVESMGNEQEHKKHKKSKKRSKTESESSVKQPVTSSNQEDLIITSTQVDKSNLPRQNLNESLFDFAQKNLPIQNIGNEVSEDELEIEGLIEEAKLHLQSPKKKSKKVRLESENYTKTVEDPAHILKTFEQRNLSFKKVNFESDSLYNIKKSRSCFVLKVPVELDPNQLIGKDISFDKKNRINVGTREYVIAPRESEINLHVFGENNRHLRFEVSRIVTMKPNSKVEVLSSKENEILNNLISEQVISVSSSNEYEKQTKLTKSPTKNVQSNMHQWIEDGAKFLKDAKSIVDLERETNMVLQKQVELLQEQNTSTAEYKKTKKELEKQTRELLHKRVNIMKRKKGGSDGELSDYF